MSELFGLPAHPLLVHIPVVLIPVAAIGLIAIAVRPSWSRAGRWPVLVLSFVGMLGAIFAAGAGESLEEQIVAKEGRQGLANLADHAEAGDIARNLSIVLFAVTLLVVFVPWYLERRRAGNDTAVAPKWVRPVLIGLAVLGSVAAVGSVVSAGHSGARSVWCETNDSC
jgi:uncharacterized membrane protein